jgi:predicted transcriptional regulator
MPPRQPEEASGSRFSENLNKGVWEECMELILTNTERELLLEILNAHHRELFREIARTDHRELKSVLKNKEALVDSVVNKLELVQLGELMSHSA